LSYNILLWLFWRWDLMRYLTGLSMNHHPRNLSFPSN
jgi:hypothetical protein